jgi:hypothetical protein
MLVCMVEVGTIVAGMAEFYVTTDLCGLEVGIIRSSFFVETGMADVGAALISDLPKVDVGCLSCLVEDEIMELVAEVVCGFTEAGTLAVEVAIVSLLSAVQKQCLVLLLQTVW